MTLPGENGQNLVEWRFRKEQTRGKVIVFGRKLRVSRCFANLVTDDELLPVTFLSPQTRFQCYKPVLSPASPFYFLMSGFIF